MIKSQPIKIVALVFPGIPLVILLSFAIGETMGGDWSGLGHLAQAAPIILLMWLGWKRPLLGGILLMLLSFLAAYSLIDVLLSPEWLATFLLIIAPLLMSGILFLGTAVLERKAA